MDLLIIGDHHGDVESTLTYLEKLQKFKFDVIVYTGDFTDVNVPKNFTQEDITKLIIEELRTLKKPIVAVPGNNDTFGVIEILKKEKISIHGSGIIVDDVGFYGYGGAKTPFNTNIEPTEEEVKRGLERGWKDVESIEKKIQVTHSPPFNTRLDFISIGTHVGSKVVKEFIELRKPLLAVSAHVHEARGTDRSGNTFLLNAGRFSEGYFGMVNIKGNIVEGRVLSLVE